MSKSKIIAVMLAFILLIMIVPTTFAMENQTASDISVNDDDVLASEYYFDAGIDNDNGNGTKYNPYKQLKNNRLSDDSIIRLEDGEYDLNGYTANVTSSNGRITVVVTEESPSSRDTFVGSITLSEGNSEIGYSTKTYYIS